MSKHEQEMYDQGYASYLEGVKEYQCPYSNMDAEYWSDGWNDAMEDSL